MTRIAVAVLVLFGLAGLVAFTLNISSDAKSVFDGLGSAGEAVPTEPGREILIGVDAPTLELRATVTKEIAAYLRDDPLVESANYGPTPPSGAFLDWIWLNRFQLAPPSRMDFSSAVMAGNLNVARDMFGGFEGTALGDQLLLDPTGSYKRIIDGLGAIVARPDQVNGMWQSIDGNTSLLFAVLKDRPFDAREVYAMSEKIRDIAGKSDASVYFLGARTIAAETTLRTFSASARASIVAGGLLFAWLAFSLRSIAAVFRILLPLALGVTSAILVTQLVFGYVHVIALGFGGVLVGLALDYPIHLLGAHGVTRRRAFQLVLLGAMTTSLAFLAMLGSQIPALMQTGVFVATGLSISAIAAGLLPFSDTRIQFGFPLHKFIWKLRFKPAVEAVVAIGGLAFVLTFQTQAPLNLFAPPASIVDEISLMTTKLRLPSGRYTIAVTGRDIDDLLSNEQELAQTLERAVADGVLQSFSMLSNFLPAPTGSLPSLDDFQTNVEQALKLAGMSVAFSDAQLESYALARNAPRIDIEQLERFPETRAISSQISRTQTGLREYVQLYLPSGAGPPNLDIVTSGATLVDRLAPVHQAIGDIRHKVGIWLAAGLAIAVVLLALGTQSLKRAGQVFLTSGATIGITASIMVAIFGSLSLFQILALALVVGIGIDYSLFINELKEKARGATIPLSVSLCATSTLIAFVVLSFSGVQILQQVGLTVVVGLIVMLVFLLAETKESS